MPYDEVVRLLRNWQRWAATWFPDLGVQPPPAFEMWRPFGDARDEGWGDVAPDARDPDIDEREAERVDKAIMTIGAAHIKALKNRFLHRDRRRWPDRETLDAAIRALGDVL